MLKQTPSQTVGPFFHIGLVREGENELVSEKSLGRRIHILGSVQDGRGEPVPDALIELWQADAAGIYRHPADARLPNADPNFTGFGRSPTDPEGRFWFHTVKPGQVPSSNHSRQAPHINVRVFARGMLIHAVTRIYFPDEESNLSDPVLTSIPSERRNTLIASSETADSYRFDIVLQGSSETIFFNP